MAPASWSEGFEMAINCVRFVILSGLLVPLVQLNLSRADFLGKLLSSCSLLELCSQLALFSSTGYPAFFSIAFVLLGTYYSYGLSSQNLALKPVSEHPQHKQMRSIVTFIPPDGGVTLSLVFLL